MPWTGDGFAARPPGTASDGLGSLMHRGGVSVRVGLAGASAPPRSATIFKRPGGQAETLPLLPSIRHHQNYTSQEAPAEPHEFDGTLQLSAGSETEELAFHMAEPEGHHH